MRSRRPEDQGGALSERERVREREEDRGRERRGHQGTEGVRNLPPRAVPAPPRCLVSGNRPRPSMVTKNDENSQWQQSHLGQAVELGGHCGVKSGRILCRRRKRTLRYGRL